MLVLKPPCAFPPGELEVFRREFLKRKENIYGSSGLGDEEAYYWLKKRRWLKYRDSFMFFSYDTVEDEVIGCIRCSLTNSASGIIHGAFNLGYSIRPSMRRQGYGKEQLRLALEFLESFGDETFAFAAADCGNIPSQKTILSCGGELVHTTDTHYIYQFTFDRDKYGRPVF